MLSKEIDTRLNGGEIIINEENYGWFGDGYTFVVIKYENNAIEKEFDANGHWNNLPLSENLDSFLNNQGYNKHFNIPQIDDGYYYFYDRHSMSTDHYSDAELFNMSERGSFNFSFAIYDSENNLLYFGRENT